MTRTKPPTTMSLQELLDKKLPERRPLVSPWLLQGEQAMVYAPTGLGKSMLCLTIALLVAGGGEVIGWKGQEPRAVLYVDAEMSQGAIQDRARTLMESVAGLNRAAVGRNFRLMVKTAQDAETWFPDLSDPEKRDAILMEARDHGAELVILDNLSTMATIADENAAGSVAPVVDFLMELKAEQRAVILVHHSGKGTNAGTYRGSSRLATTFDVVIGLREPKGVDAECGGAAFTIEFEKYRNEPNEATQPRDVKLQAVAGVTQWITAQSMTDDMRTLQCEFLKRKHVSQKAVADALGWDGGKTSRLKDKMVKLGHMTDADVAGYLKDAREMVTDF